MRHEILRLLENNSRMRESSADILPLLTGIKQTQRK